MSIANRSGQPTSPLVLVQDTEAGPQPQPQRVDAPPTGGSTGNAVDDAAAILSVIASINRQTQTPEAPPRQQPPPPPLRRQTNIGPITQPNTRQTTPQVVADRQIGTEPQGDFGLDNVGARWTDFWVNRASPEDTLRYSRLGDIMNNMRWLGPVTAPVLTAQKGGTGGSIGETNLGEWEQHEINTEEMRQQERVRLVNELKQRERILRSGRLQGEALARETKAYEQLLQQLNFIFEEENTRHRFAFQTFLAGLDLPRAQAQAINDLEAQGNFVLASHLAQSLRQINMSPPQRVQLEQLGRMFAANPNMSAEDLIAMMSRFTGGADMQAFTNMLTGMIREGGGTVDTVRFLLGSMFTIPSPLREE